MPTEAYLLVEAVQNPGWDALFTQFDDANYRQLNAYAQAAASRVGAQSENVAIHADGELLGLCNVRIRKLPLLPFGIAYVNGAPLIKKSASASDAAATLTRCLKALRKTFVDQQGHVLRVVGVARADLPDAVTRSCFQAAGFVLSEAKGHYRTILVDVTPELPALRRGLDQKWRNALNKAERQSLHIERGTDAAMFEAFCTLHAGLVARKNLAVELGPEFFQGIQDALPESSRLVVHLAHSEGEVVAGHIGAYHGDTAVYLLGAANALGLKTNASYLLQWRVMEYARERGCLWYDLGGIDPVVNPDVYRFKARIGGQEVSAPGPYECGDPLRRKLLQGLESIYRKVKK